MTKSRSGKNLAYRLLIVAGVFGIMCLIVSIIFHASFQRGILYSQSERYISGEFNDLNNIAPYKDIKIDPVSMRIAHVYALLWTVVVILYFIPEMSRRDKFLMVLLDISCAILCGIFVLLAVRAFCLAIIYIGYHLITGISINYL